MSLGRLPMKNIANPPELFKVFPIEEQATQKVKPGAAAAPGKAGAGAPAAAGSAPGSTFKI